jgi:hypothetical protein
MLSAVFSIKAWNRNKSLGGLGDDIVSVLTVAGISGVPVAGDVVEAEL